MAKRKSNKKSAKSKNAKCAKIQQEAPIEHRPGFKNLLITSLTKLTVAATEACTEVGALFLLGTEGKIGFQNRKIGFQSPHTCIFPTFTSEIKALTMLVSL